MCKFDKYATLFAILSQIYLWNYIIFDKSELEFGILFKKTFQIHWILESLIWTLAIHGTGKYHCVSLDYIHGSKRVKNVSRNMWMLPYIKPLSD